MKVGVVYASPAQVLKMIELEDGATVQNAIDVSGILTICPDIDLKQQKVGVYGKLVKLDAPLKDGDRVEIYRRITRVLDEDDDDDDDD